jgi:UDP-glucose 4-epimerase
MEQVVRDACHAHGLRATMMRYFNAAGADPDAEIGEDHDPETHLIPLVLQSAAGSGGPVTVFGTDYPTPDGTCIRDYVHVQDLASAHVLGLQHMEEAAGVAAFNLGTGRGYSVREIIDAARRVTGRDPRIVEGPRRPGDPPELVADATRARRILGWRPQFTDIDSIIETAWRWHCRSSAATEVAGQAG